MENPNEHGGVIVGGGLAGLSVAGTQSSRVLASCSPPVGRFATRPLEDVADGLANERRQSLQALAVVIDRDHDAPHSGRGRDAPEQRPS